MPKQSQIARFETNGVRLADGSFEPADAVIFCTGYTLCMDYFDKSVLNTLKFNPKKEKMPIMLYNYTVHPDLENLALVGEINGLFFAGFELQARWAIKLFKGEKQLPPREKIEAEMRHDERLREKAGHNQYPHGIYNELIDKLAAEVDALPDFDELKQNDPDLYRMLWKNGTIVSHFCYKEKPELCIDIMKEVDEIIQKKYVFEEHELDDRSTALLAQKFSRNFRIPLHLFKD